MNEIILSPLKLSDIEIIIQDSVRKGIERTLQSKTDNQNDSDLLDIKQASQLLGLAIPTLYAKVSERIIPHSKRGKKLYFSKNQLNEWVRSGKRKTQEEIQIEATQFVNHTKSKKAA